MVVNTQSPPTLRRNSWSTPNLHTDKMRDHVTEIHTTNLTKEEDSITLLFVFFLRNGNFNNQDIIDILKYKIIQLICHFNDSQLSNLTDTDKNIEDISRKILERNIHNVRLEMLNDIKKTYTFIQKHYKENTYIFREQNLDTIDKYLKICQDYLNADINEEEFEEFKTKLQNVLKKLSKQNKPFDYVSICFDSLPLKLQVDIKSFLFSNDTEGILSESSQVEKLIDGKKKDIIPISFINQTIYLLLNIAFFLSLPCALIGRYIAPLVSLLLVSGYGNTVYVSEERDRTLLKDSPGFMHRFNTSQLESENELYGNGFKRLDERIKKHPEKFKALVVRLIKDEWQGPTNDGNKFLHKILMRIFYQEFGYTHNPKSPLSKLLDRLADCHDPIFGPLVSASTLNVSSGDAVVALDRLCSLILNLIIATMLKYDYEHKGTKGYKPHINQDSEKFLWARLSQLSERYDVLLNPSITNEMLVKQIDDLLKFCEKQVVEYKNNPKGYKFPQSECFEKINVGIKKPLQRIFENDPKKFKDFEFFWKRMVFSKALTLSFFNPLRTVTQNISMLLYEKDELTRSEYYNTTIAKFVPRVNKDGLQPYTINSVVYSILNAMEDLDRPKWAWLKKMLVRDLMAIQQMPYYPFNGRDKNLDQGRPCPFGKYAYNITNAVAGIVKETVSYERPKDPNLLDFFRDPFFLDLRLKELLIDPELPKLPKPSIKKGKKTKIAKSLAKYKALKSKALKRKEEIKEMRLSNKKSANLGKNKLWQKKLLFWTKFLGRLFPHQDDRAGPGCLLKPEGHALVEESALFQNWLTEKTPISNQSIGVLKKI